MVLITFTSIFLLFYTWNASYGLQTCDDCISYLDCQDAMSLVKNTKNRSETLRIFKNVYCGMQIRPSTPKVCCSELSNILHQGKMEMSLDTALLPTSCGEIKWSRIGGFAEFMYDLPWMVLIAYSREDSYPEFGCGGSIINSLYILTSSYCVKNKKIFGVRLGMREKQYDRYCKDVNDQDPKCLLSVQDVAVDVSILHPNYTVFPIVTNNIALLRVKNPINFAFENVKPICLPLSQQLRKPLQESELSLIAGWGLNDDTSSFGDLFKENTRIITSTNCSELYKRNSYIRRHIGNSEPISDNEFCVVEHERPVSDLGGPLITAKTHDGTERYFQYGIKSYGRSGFINTLPDVYTDVTKYLDWILLNIKE